jgi:hypothetical protein
VRAGVGDLLGRSLRDVHEANLGRHPGGVAGRFTDRPTISYSPMTGQRFARNLLSPVPLDALMFVIQGGTPADFILGLTAQSIEGLHNYSLLGGQFRPRDPQFARLLRTLRVLQEASAIELEVLKRKDETEIWLRLHSVDPSRPDLAEQIAESKRMLGVPAGLDRVRIIFATRAPEPGVVGIRTRSLL